MAERIKKQGKNVLNPGITLWRRAINSIPGGNGLLSKRPDRYAPDIWPTYFSKAKGAEVWGLDGKRYLDMTQMGVGACILGYADKDVDDAVKSAIDKGVSSTLNATEEVCLAERLLELNPFAGGAKFARSGGEAMAIAIRIARAASGKDKVAFSGYHGWCDWYLSANLTGENKLTDHLLPGLKPRGVPKGLRDTAFPFAYNRPEELVRIVKKHDIGVIVYEGARYELPGKGFLSCIYEIARKKDIIVVVDEITSGWRLTDGGVYKILGSRPDIAVYGKAMGNGFAISAVIGKKEVMKYAQETFISSTFWTERVGFAAALATIAKLTKDKVWRHLDKTGGAIGRGWLDSAMSHGLRIKITEFNPLITFRFDYGYMNSALYTLFTQEMLRKGYLASNSVYASYAHKEDMVNDYLKDVDQTFGFIADSIKKNDVIKRLTTRVRYEGFKRLT